MSDVRILKSDIGSGVYQIINAGIQSVFLVLTVVFAALEGNTSVVVLQAVTMGMMIVYYTISSITSFCGSLKAINVMLRIERGFYSAMISLIAGSTGILLLTGASGWRLAGIAWGLGAIGILYGALTGRGGEKMFQVIQIVSLFNAVFHILFASNGLVIWFLPVFAGFTFTSLLLIKRTPLWKRLFPFVLETISGSLFFIAIMLFIYR